MRTIRLLILCASLGWISPARAETDVEFILDVSGSMVQKLNGEAQIDSARKAVAAALEEVQPTQLVALRVYGHRVDQTKKEESCKDTELLIPFKPVNKGEITAKLQPLTPKGYTPIAYSLEQSRNDLLDVATGRETERVIILMTDGEETCGGDPLAVLKKLKDEGFRLTVYTVGFNVSDVARKQLEDIAQFTGGKYFDAKSSTELNSALRDATKESVVLLKKTKATYGSEIRGGDSYETAVPLELGKEYKLDHHQKKDDFDYFFIESKKGDSITAYLNTLEKGAHFRDDNRIEETSNPYAGLELHDGQRNKQKHLQIIGTRSKAEQVTFRPKEDGRYYFLVGNAYEAMHKDGTTFKVSIERKGDLGTEQDAGDGLDTALKLTPGRHSKNSIGDTDGLDVYSFDAKKDDMVVIGIVPDSKESGWFTIRLIDDFKQNLYDKSSQSNAGLKTEEIKIPEDGTFYIELKYNHEQIMDYSLVLKKSEAAIEKGGEAGGTAAQ